MKKEDTKELEHVQDIGKTQAIAPIQDEATVLISQAINKGVDVATMEKLLAMRRELKAEKAQEQFDQAMKSFQAAMPTIQKTTQGYNYKYADLTAIVEQVKTTLAENGFSYTFDTSEEENKLIIYCKVKHIGGHMEVSKAYITKETTTKMNASQQSGAAMTYGKRYAFVNAFGILTGDEDTDAHTPKEQPMTPHQMAQHKEQSQSGNGNGYKPTEKQINFLKKLIKDANRTEEQFLETRNITKFEDLTGQEVSDAIAKLLEYLKKHPKKQQDPEPTVNVDDIPDNLGE